MVGAAVRTAETKYDFVIVGVILTLAILAGGLTYLFCIHQSGAFK